MRIEQVFEHLDAIIDRASQAERAALVVRLSAVLAALGGRLSEQPDGRLLTVEEASARWSIRKRRLWSWSRAKGAEVWAVRAGARSLLVRAEAFERWLADRNKDLTRAKARRARAKEHEGADSGGAEAY